jgi:hypothetical protein
MSKELEHLYKKSSDSNERQIEIGLKTLHLIFLSHAGAIVAFLGFLAHKTQDNYLSDKWLWGVLCFIFGIIFVIGSYAVSYFQQMKITQSYDNQYNYHKSFESYNIKKNNVEISQEDLKSLYTYLEKMHEIIINPFSNVRLKWAISLAVISVIFFLCGSILVLCGFKYS